MPATGAVVLGVHCRAYYAAPLEEDEDWEDAEWEDLGQIQGLSKNQSRDEAEIKERALLETTFAVGHHTREITFQLTRRPGAEAHDAIESAYETGTPIPLAIMNGDIEEDEDVRGYLAEMIITAFNDNQEHTGSAIEVTAKPAASYVVPPLAVGIDDAGT